MRTPRRGARRLEYPMYHWLFFGPFFPETKVPCADSHPCARCGPHDGEQGDGSIPCTIGCFWDCFSRKQRSLSLVAWGTGPDVGTFCPWQEYSTRVLICQIGDAAMQRPPWDGQARPGEREQHGFPARGVRHCDGMGNLEAQPAVPVALEFEAEWCSAEGRQCLAGKEIGGPGASTGRQVQLHLLPMRR
jgi:hypothetical protein